MGRMICLVEIVEDESLVDVMALDDVLFDDLEHEFLAEHVVSHKPVALAEVRQLLPKDVWQDQCAFTTRVVLCKQIL